MSPQTIEVWDIEVEPADDRKHGLPSLKKESLNAIATEVDLDVLTRKLSAVLADFRSMLDEQTQSESGYYVDEIELSFGVNGKGSVALLGKLEAGMQTGIKVKIRRNTDDQE